MEIPTDEDIRAARKEKGLTQAELAELAGVSQPLIARIESHDIDPTVDTLYNVVSALNESTSELGEEEVKMSMPSVLKDARKRTGYTQGELAEIADVSQPLISRIERQDVNPRSSTLRSLFRHLDPTPDLENKKSKAKSTTDSGVLEKIEREFNNLQDSSSPETKIRTSDIKSSCIECNSDLSDYSDPDYCPNCGTKL